MTPKLFSELGLSPEILKGIDKLGFEQAAPIQAAAIPVLMSGKDVVGQSQTGSGKTAAFAIPAIEKTDPRERAVQILILCPTRELAVQVAEEVHKLAFFKRGIHALPIYGGQSYDRQLIGLRQGAQIVIGTPGRVMDHMERGTLRLENLKMLILDEADVMLNMGFRDDIEHILKSTPPTRQTVFFSATMPRPIRDLIERHSKTPENVRVEQQAMTVPTVEQIYFEVDRRWKIEVLTRLIDIHDLKLVIIFCNTKRMVDELVEHLNTQGYSAEGLHGDMNQAQRDRVMNKFRKSGLEFLVATDVAARGIDVDDIQAVFNYDLPYDVEDYVHRIGRTGRAGRSGMAFSFVAGRELFQIRNIERFTKMRIQRGRVPSLEEVDEARANVLLDKVRTTLQVGKFQRQDHAVERLLEEGFDSTDIISAMLHLLEGGEPGTPDRAEGDDERETPARSVAPAFTTPAPAAPKQPLCAPAKPAAPGRDAVPRIAPAPKHETKPAVPAPARIAPLADAPTVADQQVGPTEAPVSNPAAPAAAEAAPIAEAQPTVPPLPAGEGRGEGENAQPPAASAELKLPVESAAPPVTDLDSQPSNAADLRKLINQPRKPGPPKKELRTALDRPAARQPVRRDYDQYEDQPGERPQRDDSGPARGPAPRRSAPSRRTPAEMTRLWMSVGEQHGVAPGDVVGCILGETGLPSGTVGVVDIRERHTFVDVAADSVNAIITKLNRTAIRGQRLKVKLA
ncbi:MAG: ATP-dependent RNA helicase DeaD [Limisphaerales bacterium]|nr:MAG: ATP-dependent RNA helicase DeaD [Limisphaerales bacterium]KAG0506772.1 MAG: ATP-dependent RNA helicase DeaD [Limisphaerales bacterium]TXT45628.1 MAG: ATP-dependent RNA helicase DeaD [Limisphaerales bacterium]